MKIKHTKASGANANTDAALDAAARTSKGCREGADPLLDLVTARRERLGRALVLRLALERAGNVGRGLRHAAKCRSRVDHLGELPGTDAINAREPTREARAPRVRVDDRHAATVRYP